MKLNIYDKDNVIKCIVAADDSSSHQMEIQGDNLLNLSFSSYECIKIDVNDYVDFCGERFWAIESYIPEQISSVEWKYNLKMYGIQSLIGRFLVLKQVDGDNESVFSLTAPASAHLKIIVDSINAGMGVSEWKTGECVPTENIVIDYSGTYCNEALCTLAEKADTEFWFDGTTVNLTRCEHGAPITLAYKNGLTSLMQTSADNVKFFTRLFPEGSDRNIDREKYGHTRLQLPNGIKHIDRDIESYGVIHHYEKDAFSNIYPRRVGKVSSVRVTDAKSDDGTPFKIYWFKDSSLDFNPDKYELAGLVKQVTFQSGELNGRDFEVNWHESRKEFEIITQWPYDDGRQVPGESLIPKVGDDYILWNISMPDEYYPRAEQEFLDAVNKYMDEHRKDVSVFKSHTDYIDLDKRNISLTIGQRVRLESNQYFRTGHKSTRITRLSRSLDNPSDADIEMSDVLSKGTISKIQDGIEETKSYVDSVSGSLPGIVKSWEGTKLTDTNLMSSARTLLEIARKAVSKEHDDSVSGVITFLKGLVSDLEIHALKGVEVGNYQTGKPGAGGAVLVDKDGNSKAEVDYLDVRKVAKFNKLVIQETKHIGGKMVLSPASMVCSRVEETESSFKCFFETTDGDGNRVFNQFEAGDQAIRQTFNISGSVYYWRLVVAVGDDYIELSKTDCDEGSGAPQKGDEIVQLGNRNDKTRQAAQILSAYGSGSPSYEVFNGINSYSLAGKNIAGIVFNEETGEPQAYCYGDSYTGDRDIDDPEATFMTFQKKAGEERKKLHIQAEVSLGAGSCGLSNLSEWAGKQQEIDDAMTSAGTAQDTANEAQQTADEALRKAQDAKDYIDSTLPTEIAEINRRLDGVVENWYGDYTPNLNNVPASGWTTESERKNHIGDTFTNTQSYTDATSTPDAGKSWRWVGDGGYRWALIADSDAVKALQDAAKAQDTADAKRRCFIATPYTPYDVGDMWMQGNGGDIMRCIKARSTGAYTASDWDKASKYTDDTAANAAQAAADKAQVAANAAKGAADAAQSTANSAASSANSANSELSKLKSDGSISPVEKTALKQQLSDINAEYAQISADADKYGVSKTAYTTAYNSAKSALTKYSAVSPEYINIGSDYANISAYYTARQTILNAIAAAAKDLSASAAELAENVKILAEAASGKMIYNDPEFAEGTNRIKVYNYGGDVNALTLTRKQIAGIPNSSGYGIEIAVNIEGYITKDLGGFYFGYIGKQSGRYVCNFIAKIPKGYQLKFYTNALGTGAVTKWITPHIGTGDWCRYAYYVQCGTGSVTDTFYFTISNGARPVTWQIAYATVFDLSGNSQDAAKKAQAAADAASSAAAQAGKVASDAAARLNDWANDAKISPTEKPALKDEISRIDADKTQILSGYAKYNMGTPDAYVTAYATYRGQLVSLTASTPENIAIPANFRTNQTKYYSDRSTALDTIAVAAKDYADSLSKTDRNHTNTAVANSKDALAQKLGYTNWSAMVAGAEAGKTVIKGGHLNTQLIEAGSIVANMIGAGAITSNKIATNSITADKIDLVNLFAQAIVANKMTLADGCQIGEGIRVQNGRLVIDLPNIQGSIMLNESSGLLMTTENGFKAQVGGCGSPAIAAQSPGGVLQCYLFNVAFAAAAAEKDYAIYLPSGLLGGLRLPIKIITASSSVIQAMDSIIVAMYTAGTQTISLPINPALGSWVKIINDVRRGSYRLVIRGNNKRIETAAGADKSSVETAVRQVLEFYYDGERWHQIICN